MKPPNLESPLEHPDLDTLRQALNEMTGWVLKDFVNFPTSKIGKTATRPEMEKLLREPVPEQGQSLPEVIRQFHEKIAPWTIQSGHPRFLAFVPGGPTLVSMLGDWLCAASNFFCGVWLEAAGPTQIEIIVLDWFKSFLGFPAEAGGLLTSGGSEANLLALVTARESLTKDQRGRAVLYVSEQRHWSIDRAGRIMGLQPEQIRPLAIDTHGRLRVDALADAIEDDKKHGRQPWVLVANAGATSTGAVDPLEKLAELSATHGLWLHIDAAYGWSAVLTEEGRTLMRGIDRADSITLDPHKWLAQTFDVGCLLMRDGKKLLETFCVRPEYMQDLEPAAGEVNFADCGLALTRRFRALKIWLSLKVLGRDWFRRLVERCFRLAELAQALLERAGCFEILHPPQLSVLCFRYVPPGWSATATEREFMLDQLNRKLCAALCQTGQAFLSTTRFQSRLALRICFVNWRTTAGDVRQVVALLTSLGRSLAVDEKMS